MDLPPAEAAGLLDASRDAFTAGVGAALVALRHVGPTRNNDHEMELEKTSR